MSRSRRGGLPPAFLPPPDFAPPPTATADVIVLPGIARNPDAGRFPVHIMLDGADFNALSNLAQAHWEGNIRAAAGDLLRLAIRENAPGRRKQGEA